LNDETTGKGKTEGEHKERDWYEWATLVIAVFGLLGLWYYAYWAKVQAVATNASVVQQTAATRAGQDAAKAAQDSNVQAAKEFAATERARMVVGNEKGTLAEFQNVDKDTTNLVLFFRNDGHLPAQNVLDVYATLRVVRGQSTAYRYAELNPAPGLFQSGPTIAGGEPLVGYTALSRKDAELIVQSKEALRLIGRITYADDFGSYCEPFALVSEWKPFRFEPALLPPTKGVCQPNSPDMETFTFDQSGNFAVGFNLQGGEHIPGQP